MTDLKKHNIISAATVSRLIKIAEHNGRKKEKAEQERYHRRFKKENPCSRCSFTPGQKACEEYRVIGGFYGVCTGFNKRGKKL